MNECLRFRYVEIIETYKEKIKAWMNAFLCSYMSPMKQMLQFTYLNLYLTTATID